MYFDYVVEVMLLVDEVEVMLLVGEVEVMLGC